MQILIVLVLVVGIGMIAGKDFVQCGILRYNKCMTINHTALVNS